MFESTGNLLFSVHGGGDGVGLSGLISNFLAAIETLISLPPGERFSALLPGIAAMENIHPLFVHFPIALLSVFFLIDITASFLQKPDWRHTASWFLYLGTVFAGLTVLAGLHAASTVPHGEDVHEIMETHEHLGITIFLLATGLSVWRLSAKGVLHGAANVLYMIFAGLLCLLLVFAADFGGLMVYKYGVAVASSEVMHKDEFSQHDHEHFHEHEHEHMH